MTLPKMELEGISLVLVGSFNPQIFQPAWFAAEGLVSKEEAKAAEIQVIHPEVVAFSTEWLHLEVLRERWHASTVQPPSYEILRDLVVGTFTVLHHTPVTMLGMNHDRHFRMESEDDWHALGHRLVPQANWGVLEKPGMRSLTVEGVRSDGLRGAIRVKVEPSIRVRHGVYVNINDHVEFEVAEEELRTADAAMETIRGNWSPFLGRADEIANGIFGGQP